MPAYDSPTISITVVERQHSFWMGPVVRPPAVRAKGPEFKPPVDRVHLEIYFSSLYVRRSWFNDIESGLDLVDLGSIPARRLV